MTVDQTYWNQAFKLAHYILGDERLALYVVVHGMESVSLKAKNQKERKGTNIMTLSDPQLFQVGVLEASEFYEKRQESEQFGFGMKPQSSLLELLIDLGFSAESAASKRTARMLTEKDLVIRYIKHLVQDTVSRNAYQVMVGISLFLYRHGPTQMKRIYEHIDSGQTNGKRSRGGENESVFKEARERLWAAMIERFGTLLILTENKKQFEVQGATMPVITLINNCLDHLALWHTDCDRFHDEPHQAHALIHPACYEQIIKRLEIDQPTANLIVPKFQLPQHNQRNQKPRSNHRQPLELSKEQLQMLVGVYEKLRRWRKSSKPLLLSVRVDNVECTRFDPCAKNKIVCQLKPNARIIETYSREADGDLLMAACWLSEFDESEKRVTAKTRAEGGQVVRFDIAFAEDGTATVEVSYRETNPVRWLALEWRRLAYRLAAIQLKPATALAIGAILVGLIALSVFWLRQKPSEVPEVVKQPSPVVVPSPTGSPRAEQPLLAENRGKPETGKGGSGSERDSSRRTRGLSLGSVERIYVQSFGEDEFGTALREALIDRLRQSPLTVEDRMLPAADAILLRESGSKKRPVRLRLVNKAGEVLWQASFKRLDAGQIAELAVKELVAAIESEKRKPK